MKLPPVRNYRGEMPFLVVSPTGERLASCATHILAEWSCKAMTTRQTWILQRAPQAITDADQVVALWRVVGGFNRGVRVPQTLFNPQPENRQPDDASQHGRGSLCGTGIENSGGSEREDLPSPGERFTV